MSASRLSGLQEGSIASRIREYVLTHGPAVPTAELCVAIGIDSKQLSARCLHAVRTGWLICDQRTDGGRGVLWSAGVPGRGLVDDDDGPLSTTPPAPPGSVPNSVFDLARFMERA